METVLPKNINVTKHSDARDRAAAMLRANVVAAAAQLLIAEGADALTVRRIAQELGCSTKILYTLFAGKEGLANALYQAGCSRLGEAVGAVLAGEMGPESYLRAVTEAYWRFAVEHPAFYRVMFCGAIPGFRPNESSKGSTLSAFETVRDAVSEYAAANGMRDGAMTAAQAVKTLWAPLHGVLSLHLLGHFANVGEARAIYERTSEAMIAALLPAAASRGASPFSATEADTSF